MKPKGIETEGPGVPESSSENSPPVWYVKQPHTKFDSKSGLPERVIHRATGIQMALVPAGAFRMGARPEDSDALDDERPAKLVVISQPFYMGQFEVTNKEFAAFDATHDSGSFEGFALNARWQPVVRVTWMDALAYCDHFDLELPTEAQWEFAARAGVTSRYLWGDDLRGGWGFVNASDRTAQRQFPTWKSFPWHDGYVATAISVDTI
ncbi:MAG: formylglycine-generating enzyme family protein [Planctomycetes bacterium]|nr:formylglycine-generating enzyme family protein [Planctomycetota bacterium]